MLGQPVSMLLPEVIGFRLTGKLKEGVTATDLVLTVTQMLRKKGVVGKFVEFFGPGLSNMTLADRATIGNMAPEYGATCGFFPVDAETIRYLTMSGRAGEPHRAGRGLFQGARHVARRRLGRPGLHRHCSNSTSATSFPRWPVRSGRKAGSALEAHRLRLRQGDGDGVQEDRRARQALCRSKAQSYDLGHGDVVIAAITSCTNTSNPSVLIGAGLLARNANRLGLKQKPWVKTSLAPGSQVVAEYLEKSGPAEGARPARLQPGRLRLHHLHRQFRAAAGGDLQDHQRQGADRRGGALRQPQFRGPRLARRAGKLPRLAAAGRRLCAGRHSDQGPDHRAARRGPGRQSGVPQGHLAVSRRRSTNSSPRTSPASCSRANMPTCSRATRTGATSRRRKARPTPGTTIRPMCRTRPISPACGGTPGAVAEIKGARMLGLFGDKITTDHISPAGSIKAASPAGKYLIDHGVGGRRLQPVRHAPRQS